MNEKGISLLWNDEVLSYIADKSYSEKYGARNMRRYIETAIEDKLASLIIDSNGAGLSGVSISVNNDDLILYSL